MRNILVLSILALGISGCGKVSVKGGGVDSLLGVLGSQSSVALTSASLSLTATSGFGTVNVSTTSAANTLTVTNSGQSSATGCSATLGGANSGDFIIFSNGCGATVAGSSSCNITVKATPTNSGSRTATLTYACTGVSAATTANGITVTGNYTMRTLDASWTPQYASLLSYLSFTGAIGTVDANGANLPAASVPVGPSCMMNLTGVTAPTVGYVAAPTGNGLKFDNTGANSMYLQPASGINFPLLQDMSFVFWLKWTDTTGWRRVIANGNNMVDQGYSIWLNPDDGSGTSLPGGIAFQLGSDNNSLAGGVGVYPIGGTWNDNTWHHFSFTVNKTTKVVSVYIDGVAQNIAKRTGTCGTVTGNQLNYSACAHVSTAAAFWADSTISGWANSNWTGFTGALAEFAAFNASLASGEISTIYNRQK